MKLTNKKKFLLGVILGMGFKLSIKLAITYGYRRMFGMLGLDMSVITTILAWITSWWIAEKLYDAGCKCVETFSEMLEYVKNRCDQLDFEENILG